jgi:hypothetical protein
MIWLLPHTPSTPSNPLSRQQLSLFISLPVCRLSSLLTGEGEGGGGRGVISCEWEKRKVLYKSFKILSCSRYTNNKEINLLLKLLHIMKRFTEVFICMYCSIFSNKILKVVPYTYLDIFSIKGTMTLSAYSDSEMYGTVLLGTDQYSIR